MKKIIALLLLSPIAYTDEVIKLICIDTDNEKYEQFIEIDKTNKKFITKFQIFDLEEDEYTFQGQDRSDLTNVTSYQLNRYTLELSFYVRNQTMGAIIDSLSVGIDSRVKEKNFFQCRKVEKQI